MSSSPSSSPLLQKQQWMLVFAGATAASVLPALWRRLRWRGGSAAAAAAVDPTRSTTSSAGGGTGAYETRRAVDEYLQFHYGRPEEILPYDVGPKVGGSLRGSVAPARGTSFLAACSACSTPIRMPAV